MVKIIVIHHHRTDTSFRKRQPNRPLRRIEISADASVAVMSIIETATRNSFDVGLIFPIDSWDGNDIFYLEGSKASIILSQKAYNILSEYKEECFLRKCNEFIRPGKSKRCFFDQI